MEYFLFINMSCVVVHFATKMIFKAAVDDSQSYKFDRNGRNSIKKKR